jgi:hypothetical protein
MSENSQSTPVDPVKNAEAFLAESRALNTVAARRALNAQREYLDRAFSLTENLETGVRTQVLKFLMDGARDINADCGYPEWLTPDHYQALYDREGVAKRVVHCEPEETWALDPEVYEDEQVETDTDFEAEVKNVAKAHNVWATLMQADIFSGLGQFGIILLGLNDGAALDQPVAGVQDNGVVSPGTKHELLFLRVFAEPAVRVKLREMNTKSPRYSQPVLYTVLFRDTPSWGVQGSAQSTAFDVHWTRVIHLADNLQTSRVFGTPRLQQVYNRVYDLRKIYSSSGEAFWKGGFPGLAFEIDPEVANQGIELDKESIKAEMDAYSNSLQRYIAITGMSAKTLPPLIASPKDSVEVQLQAIAITLHIPFRILFGSEEGKLAATEDSRRWNKHLARRQEKYITPSVVRPFVDRLIAFGVLPAPKKPYTVHWPDLYAPTEQDKAGVALTQTQAMQTYTSGGVSALVPPDLYLTEIMGFTVALKDAIMKQMEGFAGMPAGGGTDAEGNMLEANLWEGLGTGTGIGGGVQGPAAGNVQGSVQGTAKSYPRTTAQLYARPSLNMSPEVKQAFDQLLSLLRRTGENGHVMFANGNGVPEGTPGT